MFLRKMFVTVCLVVFCLGTVVGCSQPAGDQAPPATTAPAE
jgi:hypothetical protein